MPSSTIEQAVDVVLKATAAVTTHTGNRIYFMAAERDCAMPYITYSVVSDPHMPFSLGNEKTGQARVQVNVWHTDRVVALEISNHVRDALRFKSTMDSVVIYWSQCTGPIMLRDPDQTVFHAVVDALISYKEP